MRSRKGINCGQDDCSVLEFSLSAPLLAVFDVDHHSLTHMREPITFDWLQPTDLRD
jgi:hypothetical protein